MLMSATADFPSGSTGPPSTFTRLSGTQLGDYRLVQEAGRGAMGIVYEAIHIALVK
jgi:hypothetical protein